MKYFLWIEGTETGPYEQREVEAAVADGTIYADTLARRETGISWDPIEVLLPSVKDVVPVRKTAAEETVVQVKERTQRAPAKSMSRGHGVLVTSLLLGVLGLLIWNEVKPPTRWEYHTVTVPLSPDGFESADEAIPGRVNEMALTELGGEGWELAGSYASTESAKQGEGDVTTDLIPVEGAAKAQVLLFKRAERHPLVARYIDPLWRGPSKPAPKAIKPVAAKPEPKVVAESTEDPKPAELAPATLDAAAEPELIPEIKVALPTK